MAQPTAPPDVLPPQLVPTVLLPEILGFSPQLLLDDIINTANDAVTTTVDGMEGFLLRWAEDRANALRERRANQTKGKGKGKRKISRDDHDEDEDEWDGTEEVERGLVAFQTLLESHVDIAFDFLEVWSLRNIFAFPPDLPVVAPHHAGLDLGRTAEEEQELMQEIEELRRKIDNQRRLRRLYARAAHRSAALLARSETRLARLSFLSPTPALSTLLSLPANLQTLYTTASSLPTLPDPPTTAGADAAGGGGTREWAHRAQFLRWAEGALLARAGVRPGPPGAAARRRTGLEVHNVQGLLEAEEGAREAQMEES